MRAVVAHGPGDVRVEERAEPQAGPGEVVLAVEHGGICGSDLSYWRHGGSGTAVLKHPLVLGHEVAGRVAALGEGVTGLEVGLPATVHPASVLGDEALPERLAGRTNLHARTSYLGSAALDPHTDGGFAERVVVRADQVRPLPGGVTTRQGALAEPFGVALHAVARAGDVRGKRVLVNGVGPIGALVVAALKARGAGEVVAADLQRSSLEVARALGADDVRDLSAGDALPADVEVALEASGHPAALGGVLGAVARGGLLVQVGNLPGEAAPALLAALVTREITWVGSYRFVDEIDDALAAMAAGTDVSAVVTHEFDVADVERALQVAGDRSTGSSKVLLTF
ncbi:L-idonate 5-dehydrogenase [uncultured Pseudokineococcus sp.]|uniref:L-idonate 5-dehydrogenase n=1 Tax=uncultured Pseudokineococcus sp. TaxID=1642928 RepID=UPI0026279A94|nr:L-idonate 5-dehydrogenase [uncultured Pseudokineococcus sp.]